MVWAVLTTLFCFFPLGIASIVFASQVTSKFNAGDLEGRAAGVAPRPSSSAIYAAIAGAVLLVIAVSAAGSGSS